MTAIDRRYGHQHAAAASAPCETPPASGGATLTAADFRGLTADFEHQKVERRDQKRRSAAEQSHRRIKELIEHHIDEENWRSIFHRAREAAARGEKEFMLLRFPADLCTDRGRSINVPLASWPCA